ncbi:MAG TPA: hypothetical protein PKO06_22595, partial [Candidatus Ozemobacteraceae bacterium]|nr:hypothetical protein [Candidatus Ozemobacteraceae bacterium]
TPETELQRVDLQVRLLYRGQEYERFLLQWMPNSGWQDQDGIPRQTLKIPLKNLVAADAKALDNAQLELTQTLQLATNDRLTTVQQVPVCTGDLPIATPLETVQALALDFSLLDWTALETDRSRLIRTEVRIRQGTRQLLRSLKPERKAQGKLVIPGIVQWLVPATSLEKPGQIEVNVFFYTADGRRIPWALNGRPLEQDFTTGVWYFTDEDWKGTT